MVCIVAIVDICFRLVSRQPNILEPDYDEEIVVCEEPRPENVVEQQPVPVRRTSNRTVRLPERYRNDYVIE